MCDTHLLSSSKGRLNSGREIARGEEISTSVCRGQRMKGGLEPIILLDWRKCHDNRNQTGGGRELRGQNWGAKLALTIHNWGCGAVNFTTVSDSSGENHTKDVDGKTFLKQQDGSQ